MFMNLMKKELRELLTLANILAIALFATMYAFLGQAVGNIEKEISKKPRVGIIKLDDGIYADMVYRIIEERAEVLETPVNVEEALKKLLRENGAMLLVIPSGFSNNIEKGKSGTLKVFWLMKGTGIMDNIASEMGGGILEAIKEKLSSHLMEKLGGDPSFLTRPVVNVDTTLYRNMRIEGMTPSAVGGAIYSKIWLGAVIVLMLILTAGGSVISSMGLEKENKTLETLLTLPIKRGYIILSKTLAATIYGLVASVIYMVGFGLYMRSLTFSEEGFGPIRFEFELHDYIILAVVLFLALFSGIALSMLLGIAAKDYRNAQFLTIPITAMGIFSMLVTMFKDLANLPPVLKVITFLIPFTHAMTAMKNLLLDDYSPIFYGILYMTIFSIAITAIITWVFNTDKLITGIMWMRRKR